MCVQRVTLRPFSYWIIPGSAIIRNTTPKAQAWLRKTLMNEKEQLLKAASIETLRDKAKVRELLAERIIQQKQ